MQKLLDGESLGEAEAEQVMGCIMAGEAAEVQIGALLVLLRQRGETAAEIVGFARAMRAAARRIAPPPGVVLDTCGTGGDGVGTFNISTLAALVAAAAGLTVAKHGNRSASGRVGSADLLEALGLRLDLPLAAVEDCLGRTGFAFLFAPSHHPAMRHAAGPRRALGVRTIFNLLGPLTNPAGATHQLLGLYDGALAPTLAEVLHRLGGERALVVHGHDGMDEISPTGPTAVLEQHGATRARHTWQPEDFGLPRHPLAALQVGTLAEHVARARAILEGEAGPGLDAVALNAGAALYLGGAVPDPGSGVQEARRLLRAGAVRRKLEEIVSFSRKVP